MQRIEGRSDDVLWLTGADGRPVAIDVRRRGALARSAGGKLQIVTARRRPLAPA